jgi:hypothetical protein
MTSAAMRSFPCGGGGEPPRVPPWLEAGMGLGSQNEGVPVSKTHMAHGLASIKSLDNRGWAGLGGLGGGGG